jgi:integrase
VTDQERGRAPNKRSSIYESPKGSGKWHGWVWVGVKADGRPDRRHRRGTYAQVALAVRELERERDRAAVTRPGSTRLTVAEWGRQWLEIVAERGRAESTIARYRTDLELYVNPVIGSIRLAALTSENIERVFGRMREDGLTVASRGTCYRTLRAMLRQAQKRQRLVGDPLANVLPPSDADRPKSLAVRPEGDEWWEPGDVVATGNVPKRRAIPNESVRALLKAASKQPDTFTRWALAILCGLRQGEALGLQWGRVDWEHGTITIDRQLRRLTARHGCGTPEDAPLTRAAPEPSDHQGSSGPRHRRRARQRIWPCGRKRPIDCPNRIGISGLALLPLKTKDSARTIALAPVVMAALAARLESQAQEATTAGTAWTGPPPGHPARTVFSTATGGRIDPKRDYEAWRAILNEAGLSHARLHDARHTAATLYLEAGVQELIVQHQFGWSTAAMLPTYQHPTAALSRAASEAISKALLGEVQEPQESAEG